VLGRHAGERRRITERADEQLEQAAPHAGHVRTEVDPNVLCRSGAVGGTIVTSGGSMRYHRSANVTWELIDERAVILDGVGSTLTTLNPIGTLIWRDLEEPRRAAEVGLQLANRFPDVAAQQLESDVEDFLTQLAEDGLVVSEAL